MANCTCMENLYTTFIQDIEMSYHTYLFYHCITDTSTNIIKVNIYPIWASLSQSFFHILCLIIDSMMEAKILCDIGTFVIRSTYTDDIGTTF